MSARVLGVGPGVFVIVFFALLFAALSLLFSRTAHSKLVHLLNVTLFGVLLLILFTVPRGAPEREHAEFGYDQNGVGRLVLLVFMSIGAVGAVGLRAAGILLPERVARPISYQKDVLRKL